MQRFLSGALAWRSDSHPADAQTPGTGSVASGPSHHKPESKEQIKRWFMSYFYDQPTYRPLERFVCTATAKTDS